MKDVGEIQHEAEIAAAEERGRRRGVEDLQTMLQNAAPHIIGAGHFRLWNCKCGYCAPLQDALAPRDSDVACRHECQCGYRIIGRDERLHTYDAVHTWSKCEAAETPTAWKKPESGEELWALLREVETTLAGRREIEGASPATVSAIVAKLAAYAVHHSALAPRDSAPVCWKCGAPYRDAGACGYCQAPRGSGKDFDKENGNEKDQ